MHTMTGSIKNGVVMPDEPVSDREGAQVLITFLNDEERQALPRNRELEAIVARIVALGPNPASYTPPTQSLVALLANASNEEPIDSAEWDREWAMIEAQMKAQDLADDRSEGRL